MICAAFMCLQLCRNTQWTNVDFYFCGYESVLVSQFWETRPQSDHLTGFLFMGCILPKSNPKFLFSCKLSLRSMSWFMMRNCSPTRSENTERSLFLYVSTQLCFQALLHIPEQWVNNVCRWKNLSCFSWLCNALNSFSLCHLEVALQQQRRTLTNMLSVVCLHLKITCHRESGLGLALWPAVRPPLLPASVFICLWECLCTARQHLLRKILHAFK